MAAALGGLRGLWRGFLSLRNPAAMFQNETESDPEPASENSAGSPATSTRAPAAPALAPLKRRARRARRAGCARSPRALACGDAVNVVSNNSHSMVHHYSASFDNKK